MNLRSHQLAKRRAQLRSEIALQRDELALSIRALRAPAQAFDRARVVAAYLRDRWPIAVIGVAAIVVLTKGGVVGRLVAFVRFGRRVSRWWAIWKMARALLPRLGMRH